MSFTSNHTRLHGSPRTQSCTAAIWGAGQGNVQGNGWVCDVTLFFGAEQRVRANRGTARQIRVQGDCSTRSRSSLVSKKAACSCLDFTPLPQHSQCTSTSGIGYWVLGIWATTRDAHRARPFLPSPPTATHGERGEYLKSDWRRLELTAFCRRHLFAPPQPYGATIYPFSLSRAASGPGLAYSTRRVKDAVLV